MTEKFLKNAGKKFNPIELRKLMQEQSVKSQKTKTIVEKIDSPLAKYDKAGNLSCIICKTQVKPNVWKVHINSKQHKQKSEASKAVVEKTLKSNPSAVKIIDAPTSKTNGSIVKKTLEEVAQSHVPAGKTRKEEENPVTSILNPPQKPTEANSLENVLPEKFFDEPKESKSAESEAFENEWNRFQKEIKEQTSVSYQIEAGQQENAAIEREIEEIDDQLKRWQKVVEFETKTAEVLNKRAHSKMKESDESEDEDDDEDIPNALLDLSHWRSKKI